MELLLKSLFNSKGFHNNYLSNSFWAILGAFFSKLISFVSILWIARTLGPEIFGEYNVIQTTIGLFGTFSGLGLGLAAIKLISEWREKDIHKAEEIIGMLYLLSFLISIGVALIFFLTADLVSDRLLNNEKLKPILQITSLVVIFDSINGVQNGVLSGFEAFKKITITTTVIAIITAPLLIIGAYYYGLVGLVVMTLFTRLVSTLGYRISVQKLYKVYSIRPKFLMSYDKIKSIFGIGIPSFLGSLSTSLVNWVSTALFVNQPFGYRELGIYNAANQLRTIVLFLPDSAGKVTIPQLANAYGNGEFNKFRSTVILTFVANLVFSIVPAIALFCFRNLFGEFMGNTFNISNMLIIIVLTIGVFVASTNAIGYIFICSNLIWYDFLLRIFWGISLILLIFFYGRYNGAIGYAISILGAFIVYLVTQIIVLVLKFRYNRKPNL